MRNVDIKVSFNGEIRLFQLCESFQVLYDQVARTFRIEKFALKYRDAEGDLITVTTDVELHHAFTAGSALFFEVWPLVATVQPVAPRSPVVPAPAMMAPYYAPPSPGCSGSPFAQQGPYYAPPPQPVSPQHYPVPSYPMQPPVAVGKPRCKDFKDKAERRNFKRQHKEEWQAMKAARKAEKMQKKMAARGIVPAPVSPSAGLPQQAPLYPNLIEQVAVPVPFPHSVTACDPFKRVLMPGERFTQAWRVRNEGIYGWPAGMMLEYDPCKKNHATAATFAGPNFVVIDRPLAPGEDVVLTFNLVAPQQPGKFVGLWRLATPDHWKFGKKIKIVVKIPTPENAAKALQKAMRKAKLSEDEKHSLKEKKKAAKLAAKQAYWETKMNAKNGGDKKEWKDAKRAAKLACRDAKRQAKAAQQEAKVAYIQMRSPSSPRL